MKWFYTPDGQEQLSAEDTELPALIRSGKLTQKTYVWKEGMAEWEPAGLQDEFKPLFSAPSAPPPLPGGRPAVDAATGSAGSKKMVYIGAAAGIVIVGGGIFFFVNSKGTATESPAPIPTAEQVDLSSIQTPDATAADGGEDHSSPPSDPPSGSSSGSGGEVQEGQEYEVTIDGKSRKNDQDGVAHIGGLVTFVQNENEIGKTVKIRIVKRGKRHAVGEVIGAGTGSSAPARKSSKSSGDRKSGGGDAGEGSIQECVVTGIGKKGDPMCKIDGKVTFIHDAKLNEGDRVRVRITKSAKKVNHAELVK